MSLLIPLTCWRFLIILMSSRVYDRDRDGKNKSPNDMVK